MSHRLPANFKPTRYNLSLKTDLKAFTFEGTVQIEYDYTSTEPSDNILLHALELVITGGHVIVDNETTKLKNVSYSEEAQTATLFFEKKLAATGGTLFLQFTGVLNDKLCGFYRTSFKYEGLELFAAATQFEATDARRCFPCWDEPAVKAIFQVTITFESIENYMALSNMPATGVEEEDNGFTTVTFAESPIMSTYLLALAVGPFEYVEDHSNGLPIRVYTTPGKKEQGRFALDVTRKSLAYYEEYFGIKYPLPKMDLLAVPDFSSGAMENWGLVTYRETCVLFDIENTSTIAKQFIALCVSHEIAHQWFGNLVTMEWWTHLWLNEGFANFMEFLCVDHIFPEYDIWSQYVTDTYERALNLDALHNSHPIEVPVNHPSEIREIFDAISYQKGSSVIRMLYNFIGDADFRQGMKAYLNKFAYKNTITEDLWDSLEKASNKPVRRLMSNWTLQKGFPCLSVAYSKLDGGKMKLTLTQEKFTADGKLPMEDADKNWLIPISFISGANPVKGSETILMEGKTTEIITDDSWIKMNPGSISLYRTAYPEIMIERLLNVVQDLPAIDRLGLQSDFFALCRAGKTKTCDLLRLLKSYKNELDHTVWNSITTCMRCIGMLLSNTDYVEEFHKFTRELYGEIFKKLTWSPIAGERHTDGMTRAMVVDMLVGAGDQTIVEEANRKYRAQVEESVMIPADLRAPVYRAVSMYGDDKSFENLFNIYRASELHEEKNRVAKAIGYTKDANRINRAIEFLLSNDLRSQDKIYVILPLGISNPLVAWRMLQDNKDMFRKIYPTGSLLVATVGACTENLATEEMAQEVAKFFETNKFPGTERKVQQSIEKIRLNASWLARDSAAIKAYLS